MTGVLSLLVAELTAAMRAQRTRTYLRGAGIDR